MQIGLYIRVCIELLTSAIGIFGNITCLVALFRVRLQSDRSYNPLVLLHLLQAFFDLLICMHGLCSPLEAFALSIFTCLTLVLRPLIWFFYCLRLYCTFLLAGINFIRLLHPFIKAPAQLLLMVFFTCIVCLITASIGMLPLLIEPRFADGLCPTLGAKGQKDVSPAGDRAAVIHLLILFNLAINFLGPYSAIFHMYRKILASLGNSDDETRQLAYQELNKTYLLDSLFLGVCNLPLNLYCLVALHQSANRPTVLFLATYPSIVFATFYPFLSLAFRRMYKKAIMENSNFFVKFLLNKITTA
ncbi:unnamed protein product [Protopolystoma xenopodis]|uniref:G-protein coupled receptors family 1 profile domain-containing protein n=1 Tax=Protopolystoma xenopodis TaxID=117903 RepID=A0A3S5C8R3_9PLAT|nr:unnamed protein product [Protopolystoma xenopodis]